MNETNEAAVTVNEKCLVQTLDSRMCKSEKILRLWEKQKDARNFLSLSTKTRTTEVHAGPGNSRVV